ncbi:regulator of chromatin condensation, putative [Trypanosoma equiperdum]|uniref:Regulator of chromatin condensation, putative n=1 Tax=Trypanosoma equiperdum TaxID=5694 RepID=A0A1G4IF59_TRYEQ|nr:regulator of chromatin condensation, putative [Trypanosoma equiperdum]
MEERVSCVTENTPEPTEAATSTVIAVCGCGNDGRLGIGISDTQYKVVLIPFFLGSADSDGRPLGNIRTVRVGGYHNFVITTEGVYGWGLNENGQLGMGRGSPACVSVPTRIPFFDGKNTKDIVCGAYHTFAWTEDGLYACGKNEDGQLGLPCDDGLFSFTLVLSALQVNGDASNTADQCGGREDAAGAYGLLKRGQLTHVSCGTHHTLLALRDATLATGEADDSVAQHRSHPLLVLAAGKGDFGELGYDGDMWSILQAKAKTMQSALQNAARKTQGVDPMETEASACIDDKERQWKPKKQRRAAFSSERFQPVGLPVLLECLSTQAGTGSLEVVDLQAMHLHSAVTVRCKSAPGDGSCDTDHVRTFHWGCYYCNEVEDDASSVPREEAEAVTLHAGNEIMFRYHKAPQLLTEIEVMGSGLIGLGEEDSFSKTWVPLPLPSDAEPVNCVHNIVGREHFLIQLDNTTVVGFGDNMHGQLGAGKTKDSLILPTVILRTGSVLMCPAGVSGVDLTVRWKVERVNDTLCGVRHSLFVLEVSSFIVNTFANGPWRKWKNVDPATLC